MKLRSGRINDDMGDEKNGAPKIDSSDCRCILDLFGQGVEMSRTKTAPLYRF